jgi:hypothetical protein
MALKARGAFGNFVVDLCLSPFAAADRLNDLSNIQIKKHIPLRSLNNR